jgi:hypothetical protein
VTGVFADGVWKAAFDKTASVAISLSGGWLSLAGGGGIFSFEHGAETAKDFLSRESFLSSLDVILIPALGLFDPEPLDFRVWFKGSQDRVSQLLPNLLRGLQDFRFPALRGS